jgi:hypothetical protein
MESTELQVLQELLELMESTELQVLQELLEPTELQVLQELLEPTELQVLQGRELLDLLGRIYWTNFTFCNILGRLSLLG